MNAAAHDVLCVENRGYRAALEVGKVYRSLAGRIPDRTAERDGLLRVLDESGEDYLYPREFFASVSIPARGAKEGE